MLSIIIINFKNPPLLRLCLKSLNKVLRSDFEKEIIVVDVASTIETRNVIEEFPGIKPVCFKENIGYTKGVNNGVKNSSGDAVFILNSDIIPLKNSVENMYQHLHSNNKVGIIGPQLLNFDGTLQVSFFRLPSLWTLIYRRTFLGQLPFGKKGLDYFTMKDIDHSKPHSVDWLMGSAFMVSRKAIDEIGLMDEEMFLYMSDIDWPRRFWENGYEVIYFPEAQMYHYHQRGSKGRFDIFDIIKKETRWHIIDAIKYFRKHGIGARLAKALRRR